MYAALYSAHGVTARLVEVGETALAAIDNATHYVSGDADSDDTDQESLVAVEVTAELAATIESGVHDHWVVRDDGVYDVDIEHLIIQIDLSRNLVELLACLELLEACGIDPEFDLDLGELPTFGGDRPNSTEGVVSWDRHSLLVAGWCVGADVLFCLVSRSALDARPPHQGNESSEE